ncbi:HutD family protein [Rouxiella sp. T17]|uniref:HutD/Ves family protein n=1 Tax=Rouxiella sp. T17 TaxID=3085684 RepID=UPI002FC8AD53
MQPLVIPDSLNFFALDTLPVTPWRNGGGETREIISMPPQSSSFDWRASIATIAQDGPFSAFPGIDRSITLLTGEGVHLFTSNGSATDGLTADGIDHQLTTPAAPFAFSGDTAINAKLTAGTTTDFNIMTRRGVCRSVVSAKRESFYAPLLMGGVLLVLKGEWLLQGENLLSENQGVVWANTQDVTLELLLEAKSADSLLIWAAILPLS